MTGQPRRSSGTAAAASSTATIRSRVKISLRNTTAIKIANTALVSRSAADGAIGAWPQTQRISRYDTTAAAAVGTAIFHTPATSAKGEPSARWRQHMAAALVIETAKP